MQEIYINDNIEKINKEKEEILKIVLKLYLERKLNLYPVENEISYMYMIVLDKFDLKNIDKILVLQYIKDIINWKIDLNWISIENKLEDFMKKLEEIKNYLDWIKIMVKNTLLDI